MQARREENQNRLAEVARAIEELSIELNQRLQIEGEYIALLEQEERSLQETLALSSVPSTVPTVIAEPIFEVLSVSNQDQQQPQVPGSIETEAATAPATGHQESATSQEPSLDQEPIEFQEGDIVVVTNRHRNLQGQRAIVVRVTSHQVAIRPLNSHRIFYKKKTNLRLINRFTEEERASTVQPGRSQSS
jgi:hypothetical protein